LDEGVRRKIFRNLKVIGGIPLRIGMLILREIISCLSLSNHSCEFLDLEETFLIYALIVREKDINNDEVTEEDETLQDQESIDNQVELKNNELHDNEREEHRPVTVMENLKPSSSSKQADNSNSQGV
jgi:hypothetical protein